VGIEKSHNQWQRDTLEGRLRIDLAAMFRIAANFNWHESVGNHFSAAVSPDGSQFLMNPRWRHFSSLTASDLVLFDGRDKSVLDGPDAPDPSAWAIHSSMHAALPRARCILHVHPTYATALSALADPSLKAIDQNTARFHGRISVDLGYDGIADNDVEGQRLAAALADKDILMMGNHGVLVVGATVHEAFEDLYFLERACQTMILAYSTGQKLNAMPQELAERTADDWRRYGGMARAHFDEMKGLLARREPDYAH